MNCAICERGDDRIKKWIRHHVSYEPEIIVSLCYGCHCRLHGSGRVWQDPFALIYGKDKGPLEFSKRVVKLYRRKGIK